MDLRTLTAWRYVDLPVGTPNATQSKAATSLVSLINHAWQGVCQSMPVLDTLEELEDHEAHFVVLIVMTTAATVFKSIQVLW